MLSASRYKFDLSHFDSSLDWAFNNMTNFVVKRSGPQACKMWKFIETLSNTMFPPNGLQQPQPTWTPPPPAMTQASPILGHTDGERVVEKLKGYFSLGKNEIDKAVRADEWGLLADAILHYRNADRILSEGITAPASVESSRCVLFSSTHVFLFES